MLSPLYKLWDSEGWSTEWSEVWVVVHSSIPMYKPWNRKIPSSPPPPSYRLWDLEELSEARVVLVCSSFPIKALGLRRAKHRSKQGASHVEHSTYQSSSSHLDFKFFIVVILLWVLGNCIIWLVRCAVFLRFHPIPRDSIHEKLVPGCTDFEFPWRTDTNVRNSLINLICSN